MEYDDFQESLRKQALREATTLVHAMDRVLNHSQI